MHELSLTRDIVDICRNRATGRRIVSVTLEIGELSGVMPESIEFCFDECTRGTVVEGALLRFDLVAAKGYCRECSAEFELKTFHSSCPKCGGTDMEIISGEEMRVKTMEVA